MTETGGDKELIIGNKQLISLFFVVVALCGVFFAMGYMIGGNSARTTLGEAAPSASSAVQRQQPDPPAESPAAPPESVAAPPSDRPSPVPVDSGSEVRAEIRTAQEPVPAASGVSAPEAGASYLQVTALPRTDADGVVRTLREQKFPTILATSSKEGLFRVLVGPYHQIAQLAEAKARLKSIGFGSAFVQKQ